MPASWTCPTCSKNFSRKADFTRHRNLHTGYKPHRCPDCSKSFSQHSGLKTHLNVHTKAKPFKCGILDCKAAFGDPSSCARHRKETHCTIGAFKCPAPGCKSRIKRRSAFVAHLEQKHHLDPDHINIDAIGPTVIRPHLLAQRPAEPTASKNPFSFGQLTNVFSDDSDKVSTLSHSSRTSDTSLDLLMNFANETLLQAPFFACSSGTTQPPRLPDVPLYTLPATPQPLPHLEYHFSPSPVRDEDHPATPSPSAQGTLKSVHVVSSSKTPIPFSPFAGQFVPEEKVQQWDLDSLYWTPPFQGIHF